VIPAVASGSSRNRCRREGKGTAGSGVEPDDQYQHGHGPRRDEQRERKGRPHIPGRTADLGYPQQCRFATFTSTRSPSRAERPIGHLARCQPWVFMR
jgi:hypothetical protein